MTVTIMVGHAPDKLREMLPESVHCIWTSVPYWGLRSYGTEPQVWGGDADCTHEWGAQQRNGKRRDLKRNKRSVWPLASEPFPGAHFATAPTELVRPCILAGTSEKGCCSNCGSLWLRIVDKKLVATPAVSWGSQIDARDAAGNGGNDQGSNRASDGHTPGLASQITTIGWRPSCVCDAPIMPCTVLDPFLGSGTTALVADRLGRNCIGVELNPEYAVLAERRIKGDGPLFAEVAA